MMRQIFRPKVYLGLMFFFTIIATPALAVPPEVIRTVPENGEQNVSSDLRELHVVFDQDMTTGRNYSICGGGPKFPRMLGNPRWINKRTIVMQVKLLSNHEYQLSINSRDFKNFRSAGGEPAVPYPIHFRTDNARPKPKSDTFKLDNIEAVNELRRAVNEEYSYRDLRGIDWDKEFERYGPLMQRAKTPEKFAEMAAKMLARAKDIHVWVKIDDETVGGFKRNIRRNYKISILEKTIPGWRNRNDLVSTGRFEDGIGYIMIKSWSRRKAEILEAAFKALKDFSDCRGLIIDVRPNGGGAEPIVYAKHVYRAANEPNGFSICRDE